MRSLTESDTFQTLATSAIRMAEAILKIVEALEPIQQYQLDTGDEFTKPLCETFKPDGLGYEIWRNFVLDREDYVEIAEGLVA